MKHQIQNYFDLPKIQAYCLVRQAMDVCFRFVGLLCFILMMHQAHAAETAPSPLKGSVGMPMEWQQVVISGSELEVVPLADVHMPIVLKIDQTWPHGSDFRYDFSLYGLEKGTFDLKDYLRRKDGSSLQEIQPLPVEIESILPADRFEPSAVEHKRLPEPGGYRNTMIALGTLWIIGLGALLWSMRKQKRDSQDASEQASAPTLAEKLEPLVKKAASGTLSKEQQAHLERLLLTYWSHRLHLKPARPADRIRQLKDHEEAGPLIRAVEKWLHSKETVGDTEIQSLLEPYRSISLEGLEDFESQTNP